MNVFINEQTIEKIDNHFTLFFWKENNAFNFSLINDDEIVGYIELSENYEKGYRVTSVAAEKGFGTYMYLIAMGVVYPQPITSDRLGGTKKTAYNIFKKLFNNQNIIKEKIKKSSPDFLKKKYHYQDKNDSDILNHYYYFKPNKFVKNLVQNANKGYNLSQVKKNSYSFFEKKYSGG